MNSKKKGKDSRSLIVLLLIVVFLALAFLAFNREPTQSEGALGSENVSKVTLGYQNGTVQSVNVYLAVTSIQQTTGLMNQTSMGTCNGKGNCYGMLFVFPNLSNQCFWMENTIMPLKQFWITNNVITYEYNAIPYSTQVICHIGNEVLETNVNSTLTSGDYLR